MKDPHTFPFELSAFVLSDLTIGEEPEVVDPDLRRFHSDAVAEELADSYGTNALAPRRLRLEQDTDVRLGPLDAFVIGDEDYDWQGLQAASPGTNVIVRMSRPDMDRLETYAVVRYEFLTPHGGAWAAQRMVRERRERIVGAGAGDYRSPLAAPRDNTRRLSSLSKAIAT